MSGAPGKQRVQATHICLELPAGTIARIRAAADKPFLLWRVRKAV